MAEHNNNSLVPYLCAKGAADAIDFYKKAFGATEVWRMAGPDGKVMHADMKIGDLPFMISDEFPEHGAVSPHTLGGAAVMLALTVDDVDAIFAQAVAAGATVQKPVALQFYGHRTGYVLDPFGYRWGISTVVEKLTPEEMQARATKLFGGNQ